MTKEKNKIVQYKEWLKQKGIKKAIIYVREAEEVYLNGTWNWEHQGEVVKKFCGELGLIVEHIYYDTDSYFTNWDLMSLISEILGTNVQIGNCEPSDTIIVTVDIDRISKDVQEIISVATILKMAGYELLSINDGWFFEDFGLSPEDFENIEGLNQFYWDYYDEEYDNETEEK